MVSRQDIISLPVGDMSCQCAHYSTVLSLLHITPYRHAKRDAGLYVPMFEPKNCFSEHKKNNMSQTLTYLTSVLPCNQDFL